MKSCVFSVTLSGIFLLTPLANSQAVSDPASTSGLPPTNSYQTSGFDTINLVSGQVTTRNNLVSLPQKGRLALSYSVPVNDVNWTVEVIDIPEISVVLQYVIPSNVSVVPPFTTTGFGPPGSVYVGGYWRDQGLGVGVTSNLYVNGNCDDMFCGEFDTLIQWPVVVDAEGTSHNLLDDAQHPGNYRAVDGSGYTALGGVVVDGVFPIPATVMSPSGIVNTFSEPPTTLYDDSAVYTRVETDPNPSRDSITTTTSLSATASTTTIQDSVGRTFSEPQGAPDGPTPSPQCPVLNAPNQPLIGSETWNVPGPDGGTSSYLICYAQINTNTDFFNGAGVPPPWEIPWVWSMDAQVTVPVIQSVLLPDGSYWGYVYESADASFTVPAYGDLVQVHLPTGGTISYQHQNSPSAISGYGCSMRFLTTRTLDTGNGSPTMWNYAYSGDQYSTTTTISGPVGVAIDFSRLPTDTSGGRWAGCGSLVETDRRIYQGAAGGGTPLREVATSYQSTVAPASDFQILYPLAILPSSITTTENGVLRSVESRSYDPGFQAVTDQCSPLVGGCSLFGYAAQVSLGRLTDAKTFDGSGALLRDEQTRYVWQVPSGGAYYAAGMLDLLSSVVVTGPLNTAETDYRYDENNGSPQGAVGNLTSVSRVLNTGSSPVVTSTVYNSDGEVSRTIDANGNIKQVNSFQCNGLFSQSTTEAYGSPVAETLVQQRDCATGAVTSSTDPNGVSTAYQYNDPLGRLTQVISATGTPSEAHTTYAYPNPNQIDVAQDQSRTGDGLIKTAVLTDGFGRQIQRVQANGTLVDTTYDQAGNVASVSNPHTGSPLATDGITSFAYDALGRKTLQCDQNNGNNLPCQPGISYRQWSYNGNTTAVMDEVGNTTIQLKDGLERLVQVVEPGSLYTAYTYDAIGNLWNVLQTGNGTDVQRTRSFTYDSLSRLITSTNPETGTVCYGTGSPGGATAGLFREPIPDPSPDPPPTPKPTPPTPTPPTLPSWCSGGYDANGNLLYKTDARGALTSYTYDALNRLTSKSRAAVSYGTTSVAAATDLYYYDGQVGTWAVPQFVGGNSIGRLSFTRSFNPDLAGPSCNILQRLCDDQYYGYDTMRRQNWLVDAPPSLWGSGIAVSAAAYDLAGNMTALQYPTGRVIANGFDGAGRLQTVGTPGSPGAFIANVSYNPDGTMQSMTYGNGVMEAITENTRLQPCHFVATLGATSLMDRGYYRSSTTGGDPCAPQTGNNGNIFQIADNLAGNPYTQNFSYDNLNRLKMFDAPNFAGAVRHQDFNYDSFGNMSSPQGYSPAGPSLVGTPSARMFANPGYDQTMWPFGNNNRLMDAVFDCVGADGASHYDAAGNMLCNGSNAGLNAQQFTWDAESRVTRLSAQHAGNTYDLTAEYTYDANGNRIRSDQFTPGSTTASSWREYTYFAGMMLHDGDNTGQWTDYLYANGQKVARFSPTDTHYYLADQLGTTQMELDASGNVTWQGQFAPFGQELDDPTGTPMRFKFAGKERDAESGLDYFGARYYASSMGRWMSPDYSANSVILELPQSWNKYSYVLNRPTYAKDPDGRCPWCIGAAIGAVAEGGFDFGKQLYNNGGDLSKVNYREVGANALGGAVAGALAVATGGASLVESAVVGDIAAGATANIVGGVVTRAAQGDSANDVLSASEVSQDAVAGFVGGGVGHLAGDVIHIPDEPIRPDPRHQARTSVYNARTATRNRAIVNQSVRAGVASSAGVHGTNGGFSFFDWLFSSPPSNPHPNEHVTVTIHFDPNQQPLPQ